LCTKTNGWPSSSALAPGAIHSLEPAPSKGRAEKTRRRETASVLLSETGALDRIAGAELGRMFGGEVAKRPQFILVFQDALHRLGKLGAIFGWRGRLLEASGDWPMSGQITSEHLFLKKFLRRFPTPCR